jgi:rRNA maturation endonuclease Nob1
MGQHITQLIKPIEKPTKPIIICHKCGNQNPSENKFCGICGKPLYPPPPIQCPKCGAAMPPNIKFCRRCGFPLRKPARTRKKRD